MSDNRTPPQHPPWDRPLVDAEVRRQALDELNRLETRADAEQLLAELREDQAGMEP